MKTSTYKNSRNNAGKAPDSMPKTVARNANLRASFEIAKTLPGAKYPTRLQSQSTLRAR